LVDVLGCLGERATCDEEDVKAEDNSGNSKSRVPFFLSCSSAAAILSNSALEFHVEGEAGGTLTGEEDNGEGAPIVGGDADGGDSDGNSKFPVLKEGKLDASFVIGSILPYFSSKYA